MLQQLSLKKHLYNNGIRNLYIDSLNDNGFNDNEIDLNFNSIDGGVYFMLKEALRNKAVVTTHKRENSLINRFFNRNKVILSSV